MLFRTKKVTQKNLWKLQENYSEKDLPKGWSFLSKIGSQKPKRKVSQKEESLVSPIESQKWNRKQKGRVSVLMSVRQLGCQCLIQRKSWKWTLFQ